MPHLNFLNIFKGRFAHSVFGWILHGSRICYGFAIHMPCNVTCWIQDNTNNMHNKHYIMGFPMGWIFRKWTMYVCRFVLWKNVEINRRCSDSRMFNNYCVREPACLGCPSSRVFVVLCIFVVGPTTFFRIWKETVATFPRVRGYCHLSEQLGLIQLLRKSAKPAARAKCRVS